MDVETQVDRVFKAWWVLLGLIVVTWGLGIAAVAALVYAALWAMGVWG